MTTTCREDKGPRGRMRPFRFNPFELAFTGAPPRELSGLMTGLLRRDWGGRRIAVACNAGAESGGQGLDGAAARCVDRGGLRSVSYPAEHDAYLHSQPMVDADWVFHALPEPPVDAIPVTGPGAIPERAAAPEGGTAVCAAPPSPGPDASEGLARQIETYFEARARAVPLLGLVLAGGKSLRMGEDKARIHYHGAPQAEHAAALLGEWCGQVYVSVRPGQSPDGLAGSRDVDCIEDTFLGLGPMGGVLSALKARPDAAWLTLACDLPFMDRETLGALVAQRDPFRAATAYESPREGFPEPLCAIYEPKSVFRLLQFMALGYHCPRKVLINSPIKRLTPERPEALVNANSPDERDAVLARLGGAAR